MCKEMIFHGEPLDDVRDRNCYRNVDGTVDKYDQMLYVVFGGELNFL